MAVILLTSFIFAQIIIVVVLGNMSFQATGFWVAFFMQQVQNLRTLDIAVRLLPMAIAGLLWNVLAGQILHRVNNTLIMILGAASYVGAALLFSFMRADSNYWAFVFPALVLNVAGADLQFNVANVGRSPSLSPTSPSDVSLHRIPNRLALF